MAEVVTGGHSLLAAQSRIFEKTLSN